MEAAEVISIHERHEVQKLLVPFSRYLTLTHTLESYLGTACDIPESDIEPLRQIILDKINLMDECVSNAENLKELVAANPSAVNDALTRTLFGERLAPAEHAYWERVLERHGDAAGLATFIFAQLSELVPLAREELQEMLRSIEAGELPRGGPPPRLRAAQGGRSSDTTWECGAGIFTTITFALLGGPVGWGAAFVFAAGSGAICGKGRVFG